MRIWLDHGGRRLRVDTAHPVSLAIPLDPHGAQPSHFGASPASATALSAGSFVGDTRLGGSCNCEAVTVVAHCNGTHTEGVGHVTRQRVPVHEAALRPLVAAALVSVAPETAQGSGESADPAPQAGDRLVTAHALGAALDALGATEIGAVVVRTLPNGEDKPRRDWMRPPLPPYFSLEAARLLVQRGAEHLLVDLPSVDRLLDAGRLGAHRVFWGLEPGETDADASLRPGATITEMIFAPDHIADGIYALSLQVAAWMSDAAPSRPVLWPLAPS